MIGFIQKFEMMNDLQYFYKNGYHDDEHIKMGNAITEDLLHFLRYVQYKHLLVPLIMKQTIIDYLTLTIS